MFPEMVEEKKTGHIKWIYVTGDGEGRENRSHKIVRGRVFYLYEY
jgi:hypothetical protein